MGYKKLKDEGILESAIQELISKYKDRIRSKGLTYSLKYDEFKKLIFAPCDYCGVPAEESMRTVYANSWEFYRNTIDRVDSQIGYTSENCVPSCLVCNSRKSDEEVLQWLRWIHLVAENTKDYPGLKESPPFDRKKANGKLQLRNAQKQYVNYLAYARRGEVV